MTILKRFTGKLFVYCNIYSCCPDVYEVNMTDSHDWAQTSDRDPVDGNRAYGGILKAKMGDKWSRTKLKYLTNVINKESQTSCTIC